MAGPWEKYQQQPAIDQPQPEQAGPWAKYQAAEPIEPANDAGAEQGGIEAMDYGKELAGGVLVGTGAVVTGFGDLLTTAGNAVEQGARAVLPAGAVDALKSIPAPSDLLFRPAGRQIDAAGKDIQATKTDAAKQALEASTPQGDVLDPSSWSMGDDPTLAGYGLHGANLVGQFAPQAAALAMPGGQARMAAMAGVGGLQAGGAAGDEAEQRIAALPDAELQQASDLYRELRQSGMDETAARAQVSRTARAAAFQGAAPVGAAGGAMTHYALGPIQRQVGGGVGRRLGYGLAVDAPAEGAQEVAESVAARAATNQAIGERRDLTEDTFADAVLGAMGGAGHASLGAVIGRPEEGGRPGDPAKDADASFEDVPEPAALPASGRQGLPSPEPTFYADSQGNMQDVGPVRNVDGEMQPDQQGRQWINPRNRADRPMGGEGMERQVPRGEPAPLEGQFQHGSRQSAAETRTDQGQTVEGETEQPALPAPDAIVVDGQGNAQRGATAPQTFERPPAGGRGMDQQAPTAARRAEDNFDYITRANGDPFQAHGAARASKAFREAKKAGRNPTIAKVDGGFTVRVPADPKRYQMRPIDQAANQAATSPTNDLPAPTPAQIEAGNYKKGRVRVQGLDISIENPRGSERSGTGPDGTPWRRQMGDHYGYIKRTTGADGEQVDVYVGPQEDSDQVFVVDQLNQQDGSFDEHKVMLGYPDQVAAVQAYSANFDDGWRVGPVTAMPVAKFKSWLKGGELSKPLAAPVSGSQRDEAGPGTAAQLAQRSKGKPKGARRAVDRDRDSVVQAAIRLGGITKQWKQDTTGDTKGNKNIPGVGALWSDNTGTSLDDMASLLDQHGYVPAGEMDRDGGVSWLQDALRDELAGRKMHYAPDSVRQLEQYELEMLERINEQIAAERDLLEAEYARIEAEHGPEAAANARSFDEMAVARSEQLDGALEDAQAEPDTYVDGEPVDEAAAARRDDEIRQADEREDRPAREDIGPSFSLEQQTVRELKDQAERNAAAEKARATQEREVERKAQADRDRDDFLLTGSDRVSDVATARGQSDMFGAQPDTSNKASAQGNESGLSSDADQRYRVSEAATGSVDADTVTDAIAAAPELAGVKVVQSFDDLPLSARIRAKRDGIEPDEVRGIYSSGSTYVVAGNHASISDALFTAVHEEVGHRGIHGLLGDDLDATMDRLYTSQAATAKGRQRIAQIRQAYAKPLSKLDARSQRLMVAEEMVALLIEDGERPTALQRVLSKMRELLRALFPQVAWTYTDILALGEQSRRWLRANRTGSPGYKGTRYALAGKRQHTSEAFSDLTAKQKEALSKIAPRTAKQQAIDWFRQHSDRALLKIRQGIVDRYAALRDLDEAVHGDNILSTDITSSAWVLARMSSAASGALHAMLNNGRIYLDQQQKVIDIQDGDALGLGATLARLGSAAEIERFMGWIAGNRSAKLAADGRENLFDADEIDALRTLNRGTTEHGKARGALYNEVFAEFQQYRDDVLGIAEQTGVITPESRALWRDEFYVPFYRVMDDDGAATGPSASKGLTRQEAYKKLKGGSQNLNDLLQNTLLNFNHLLQASLRNQAAAQAIDNAEQLGIAQPVSEAARDKKASTFVLKAGIQQWYNISDPLVSEALSSLSDAGLNNAAVRAMSFFKRLFTNMTTVTPQFIIANLLRDSMSATATSPVSKNFLKNIVAGGASWTDARKRARMLASGGAFSFGHIYSSDPDEVKAHITRNLRTAKLIDGPKLVPQALKAGWDAWNAAANTAENANRAAIFEQNEQGSGKLAAAFEARDLMDFSMHGAWPAVRFLIRVVPFLNARLQGLDKLYRAGVKPSLLTAFGQGNASDKQAAARFTAVVGALSLASMALLLVNNDDEEYRKLEEWQKDTYWFVRLGGKAFFIPKPFEVGAIATMAERLLQQAVDEKATGKLFAQRLGHTLTQTFSFSPVPHMFQPVLDVYSNVDAFTGRPIESTGMDRLSKGLRARSTTTAPARAASAVSRVFGDEFPLAVSPIQADHLIAGYLGQVGAWGAGMVDTMWRAANGESQPAKHWHEYQPVRRFYRDLDAPAAYTRYSTIFYEGLREAGKAYADVKELQELGRMDEARGVIRQKRDVLGLRKQLNQVQRRLTAINSRMDAVRMGELDADAKRRELDRLLVIKNRLTEMAGKRVEDMRVKR